MIKFGPSGNGELFHVQGYKHSEQVPEFLNKLGLDCFEYSFGRGVNMSEEKAVSIGNAFRQGGIEISVHAPYFINFASPEEEKVQNSFGYVLNSARYLRLLGGKRLVFHPAAQGKVTREEAVQKTEDRLKALCELIYQNDMQDLMFCPETMGKMAQIGTVEEIVRFCKIDPVFTPCVDFGHVNAREQGSLKTQADFRSRLQFMIDELGYDRMKHFHVHFSKIMYSGKGEIKHLTFEDREYGPEFEPLSDVLHELDLQPYVVSESAGTQAEDALYMKKAFFGE